MTLTDFLLARIAEDEAAARLGAGEPRYLHHGETAAEESVDMARSEGCAEAGPDHLARWLPARVLAECEAKRRIVERCEAARLADEQETDTESGWVTAGVEDALGDVLRALALPYRDHPDYQQEWAPGWTPTPPPGGYTAEDF